MHNALQYPKLGHVFKLWLLYTQWTLVQLFFNVICVEFSQVKNMAYLNRDQRREMILQAAMQIALAEGFTAMTVRRIATEAQTSTGQVHHHFSSASHLKAEAFKADGTA